MEKRIYDVHVSILSPIFHDTCFINTEYIRHRMYQLVTVKYWKIVTKR